MKEDDSDLEGILKRQLKQNSKGYIATAMILGSLSNITNSLYKLGRSIETDRQNGQLNYYNSIRKELSIYKTISECISHIQKKLNEVSNSIIEANIGQNGYDREYWEQIKDKVLIPLKDIYLQYGKNDNITQFDKTKTEALIINTRKVEKPAKKDNKLICLSWKLDLDKIDILIAYLMRNGKFKDLKKEELIDFFKGGPRNAEKYIWHGPANSFIAIFFQLKENGNIKNTNEEIKDWICGNFVSRDKLSIVKPFASDYTLGILNKSKANKRPSIGSENYMDILAILDIKK